MALVLFDGFELAASAVSNVFVNKWTAGANVNQRIGLGRFSGNALDFSSQNTVSYLGKTLSNRKTTFVALACTFNGSYANSERVLFAWMDGASIQVSITVDTSGYVKAYRGSMGTGTLLGTSSSALTLTGDYHYWQAKVAIGNADGIVDFILDDTAILSLSGVDTQATANAYATEFRLGGNGVNGEGWGSGKYLDDVSLLDDTGPAPYNTHLPECRVEGLVPTGAGTYTTWVPNTGANWETVDDPNNIDSDTTYSASSTPGDIDSFALQNLSTAAGTVYGVTPHLWARKDDADVRQVATLMRMGGVDYLRATNTMGSGYDLFFEIMTTDPAAASWTIASINAMELGYKEIA